MYRSRWTCGIDPNCCYFGQFVSFIPHPRLLRVLGDAVAVQERKYSAPATRLTEEGYAYVCADNVVGIDCTHPYPVVSGGPLSHPP
jgi:hypothetical protein